MDNAEFERRVLSCEGKLFRIGFLSLGSYEGLEDCVQEALLKAWRRRDSLREPAYFETWLVRILINECKDMHRRRSTRPQTELPDILSMPAPPDPALKDALAVLPSKYRLPLVLHNLAGYTVDEVAQMLRLTRGMVKSRLEQAKKLLRAELSAGEGSK